MMNAGASLRARAPSRVVGRLLLAAALVGSFPDPRPLQAAELEVAAGEPAAAVWSVPTNAQCGEPFTAKLEIRDRFGNVVTDADKRGLEFEIFVAGRGEIWPKSVPARSFARGVADVQLIYKVSERIELIAKSVRKDRTAPALEGRSAPFHVAAGKLAELRVVKPISARAGMPFRVTIMALDAFGNPIKDFNARTDGVVLSADGSGRFTPTRVSAESFTDGVAEISASYTGAGEIDLRAKDPKSGVAGKSPGKLTVGAGEPSKFQITAPAAAFVDEPFDIAVTAMDAYGNVVLDYDAIGTLIFIGCDGTVLPTPSEVSAKSFVKGVAFVRVSYSRNENITLSVTEPGTSRIGVSGPVDVQAGRARRLEVSAVDAAFAGEPFVVKIRAVDSRGNVAKSPESKIILSVLGSVRTTPIELTPASFQNGVAERKMTYYVAEEIRVVAQDAAGLLAAEPTPVRIRPGKVAMIEPAAPAHVTAGSGVAVTLTALDAYKNPVFQFDQGVVLARVEGPESPPGLEIPASSFSQGKFSVSLPYFRAGTVRISAELLGGPGKRTMSSPIEILPAALYRFDVATPVQTQAGTPFRITVTARDAYDNPVIDYDKTGGGVEIHSSGIGEVQPGQIAPAAFKNGAASVEIRSYAAERITLTARERFGSAEGRSGLVKIAAGPLAQFLVSAAPKVRAGEAFPIRIEAQDMYYNLIREFDLPGRIYLMSSGAGKVTPDAITSAEFVEGIAIVSASITAAGRTELTVFTDNRKSTGRSNPIQVLPGSPSSFRVDVLDPVTAGEPFRVRVTSQDAFGNPIEDALSIDRPVRLEVFGPGIRPNPIAPAAFLPSLFTRGIAEGYLVYPEAGRITIQVKGGGPEPVRSTLDREAPWQTQIEGLFMKRGSDQTDIFVLANGPIEYRASQPTPFGAGTSALVVTIPNASVLRPLNYDVLDLPGLRAVKLGSDVGESARLVLKLDAAYGYSIESRQNLLHVTLRSGPAAGAPTLTLPPSMQPAAKSPVPSLDEIQKLVDRGEYRTARRAVELFLAAHPGHPDATAMRTRLEKVLKVLGE